MKLNIKKIFGVLSLAILLYSCDTNNEVTGYDADNYSYSYPTTFTITSDATTSTDNSFVVTYSPSAEGKGYYVVVASGTAAPTSTQVHTGNGFMQAGSFDVDGSTPVNITIDSNIFGSYTYDVYAIHKSTDNFISETVTKLSVTTPDTADPVFLGDDSNPAFTAAGISPFAPVTFTFSEPVFYQGGDITFTAFDGGSGSGRQITVNATSAMSMSGTSITVNTHGTFEQDDFIIVNWGADTFKDNVGKSVDPLTGFDHYFSTRVFTAPEAAALMVGTYNYSTRFYGGLQGFYNNLNTTYPGTFIPETGQFDLVLDPADATGTTLIGINLFSGFIGLGLGEPENLKIKFGSGGELEVIDDTPSVITTGGQGTVWGSWATAQGQFPGFYDVTTGDIGHWLTLYTVNTRETIDDIDYNYVRIGTYARSNSDRIQELIKLSEEKKNSILNGATRVLPSNVQLGY